MERTIQFMNGPWGRLAKVTLGLALIGGGLVAIGGAVGAAIAILGLGPLWLGIRGRCVLELFANGQPARTGE